MSMESMVDSMVQQPTQPTKPAAASSQPSAPSTQSDQPSQVGLDSMVSQMAAQAPAQASQTATPQAAPYTWYERAEGAVMKHIPIDEDNKVLNWINEHVAQSHVKMGTEGGNIVEHWINGVIGQGLLSAM